jgi:hypothetical protein
LSIIDQNNNINNIKPKHMNKYNYQLDSYSFNSKTNKTTTLKVSKKYFGILWLMSLLLLLTNGGLRAQTFNQYCFSAQSSNFVPIFGGTTIPTIIADDAVNGSSIPIGFSFSFNGSSYTHVWPSSNVWLALGTSTMIAPTNTYNFSYTAAPAYPVLMPWSTDAFGSTASPQLAEAKYTTTGTSPNRVFTIEWLNWTTCCTAAQGISIQVKLYEASGTVEFLYRQESTAVTPGTLRIGLAAANNLTKALNNIGSTPIIQNNIDFTITPTGRPASGQSYTFTPPGAVAYDSSYALQNNRDRKSVV